MGGGLICPEEFGGKTDKVISMDEDSSLKGGGKKK